MTVEPAAVRPRTAGRAEIGFDVRRGATRLAHLFQHEPLRVVLPGAEGDLPSALLITTSGGLVGGDRIDIAVSVGAGAAARVGPQAAEKVYRSLGPDAVLALDLQVADGGWLEYLPMETILFDGSRLDRHGRLDVAGSGRLTAGEILVFGRLARGEVLRRGRLRDALSVTVDGTPVWADALVLEDDVGRRLDHPAGLAGARGLATLVHVAHDAGSRLTLVREQMAASGVRAGATIVGPVLIARWLGDPAALRQPFARTWAALRATAGLPPRLPRSWHI